MTYSILGRDPATGEIGCAVQSKFPGVGSIVLHGRAGVGCVATQAFADPDHGAAGLGLLALGATADQALAVLLQGDGERDERQIGVLAADGAPAAHTGARVKAWDGWSGGAAGDGCVALGNTLSNDRVAPAMVGAFAATRGEIAMRLIGALRAGRDAGGEKRGLQSAAVLVVRAGGGYGGRSGRHVDISVYDHAAPIEELARCYALHRLSYFPSEPANLIGIDAALARRLKRIIAAAGVADLPEGGAWDAEAIAAMRRFMAVENYDNRLRDDALIDREVLADIEAKWGGRV